MIAKNRTAFLARIITTKFVTIVSVVYLGGCVWVGKTPPDTLTYPTSNVEISRNPDLPLGNWPVGNWWEVFDDTQLNSFMERALQGAPSLAVAEARIRSGQAVVDSVDASRGASVGLTAFLNRERISENSFLGIYSHRNPTIGATGPWYTEGVAGLTANYAFDLWGKEKAQLEAAIGRRRAQEAEAAEVKLALSARIALLYFELQSTKKQLDLLEEAQYVNVESLQARLTRFRQGLEPQTVVEKAKAQKTETAQQIDTVQARIRILTEILRSLAGFGPSDFPSIVPVPFPVKGAGIPDELGIELLSRRPDLQAFRSYIEASIGQIDAAKAAFYPSINLRTFFGYDAIHIEDLKQGTSRQFNFIPGLHLPIFDSGRLNANLTIAKTQKNLLVAQYNQAIIEAVRQVAQSGVELESANTQIALQEQRVNAAEINRAGAEAYSSTGLSDEVSSLEARLPLLVEKSRLVELRMLRMRAYINLAAALGGGYESPKDRIENIDK